MATVTTKDRGSCVPSVASTHSSEAGLVPCFSKCYIAGCSIEHAPNVCVVLYHGCAGIMLEIRHGDLHIIPWKSSHAQTVSKPTPSSLLVYVAMKLSYVRIALRLLSVLTDRSARVPCGRERCADDWVPSSQEVHPFRRQTLTQGHPDQTVAGKEY